MKEKDDINAQIRQYTSKDIHGFNKNSFRFERKERVKSKTIKHPEIINLTKNQKNNNKLFSLFKPDHLYDVNKFIKNDKNDESHLSFRNSKRKNSFSITIKGDNNFFTSLTE